MKVYHIHFDNQDLFYDEWFLNITDLEKYIEYHNDKIKGSLIWAKSEYMEIEDKVIRYPILYLSESNTVSIDQDKCYIDELDLWALAYAIFNIDYSAYRNYTSIGSVTLTDNVSDVEKNFDIIVDGYYDKYTEFHKLHTVSLCLSVTTNTKFLPQILDTDKIANYWFFHQLEAYRLGERLAKLQREYEKNRIYSYAYPLASVSV